MTTAKAARSRGTPAKENGVKFDGLNAFKSEKFNADAYVQSKCSLNEKEIKQFCTYLQDLKKVSAEEMRKSVYANYTSFIRTSKEISDLEGELSSIRNLLSAQATLIHRLADGVHISSSVKNCEEPPVNGALVNQNAEPSEMERWSIEFSDHLDVLLGERRVEEALTALDEAEHTLSIAKERKQLSPDALRLLSTAHIDGQKKLADQLADVASQPSTRGNELRTAISALRRLGDGSRAHSLLLNAHLQKCQFDMQTVSPSTSSHGRAYTMALSHVVFSTIAQAANDTLAIYGEEPAYASKLVVWATKQTEFFASLIKRHVLALSMAAGGIRAASECVQIALGHCSLLESRGLSLCPVLVKLFRPSIQQALTAHIKHMEDSISTSAASDDWAITSPMNHQRFDKYGTFSGNAAPFHLKLTSSAHWFNLMVQGFFEDLGPLSSMQLESQMLDGVFHVFNSYVNTMMRALPGLMEEETSLEGSSHKFVRMAETEMQQMALLANASLLADDLLPHAATKMPPDLADSMDCLNKGSKTQNRTPEQRDWRRRLATSVDRLKDSFCRQHALDLIFTEDGGSHLTAGLYTGIDGNIDEVEIFPSAIFQELFLKLNRMASIAADMFEGRERFATLLLMRLTETVILWLSDDQSFWEDIETDSMHLTPLGLLQFYLDMKFVIYFASQGRYFSRNLRRVTNEIIAKAVAAFSSAGLDPDSVLPEDEWFIEICQDTVERLSGKPREADGYRDLNSPAARSVSSVRSHGSS